MQTRRFWAVLLVRHYPANSMAKKSTFNFNSDPELLNLGINLHDDGTLTNYIDCESQTMNGDIPWRGSREKHLCMFQQFIEACTKPKDIVVDFSASTGNPINLVIFLIQFLLY